MKKTIIALAAMAGFAGAASAQSSVTLYGLMDVGYGYKSVTDVPKEKFQQMGNYTYTSRWGLKGSEDLGGGLKAIFNLEQAINPENGAASGFTRAALVGLEGGFGTIKAGHMFTVIDDMSWNFDLNGSANTTSAYQITGITPWMSNGSPVANGGLLRYESPDFGGFQIWGDMALKNDTQYAKNLFQLAASYKIGDLMLGGGVETKAESAGRVAGFAAATYDFGVAKVGGMYSRMGASDATVAAAGMASGLYDNDWHWGGRTTAYGQGFGLGVAVPLGAFTVGLQAARNTTANVNAYEAFANYALSKRTSLYINGAYAKDKPNGGDPTDATLKTVGAGIIHQF